MNLNQAFNYFATGIWNKVKNNFVLKELGKSLSTNDYTNEDKSNLDNLVDNIDNMINAPALVNGANKNIKNINISQKLYYETIGMLPIEPSESSFVVLNDEIHVLGGWNNGFAHYKFNNTTQTWESVSTLPYEFAAGYALVLNDEIHIMGCCWNKEDYNKHYKFNNTTQSWESVSTLPYDFNGGSAVVLNDGIHILGGDDSSRRTNHYLVGLDCRHIASMLPKGVHILLSDNEDIIYASNATKISSNIAEVTDTGYVELLAALTDMNNIKGYLTFY